MSTPPDEFVPLAGRADFAAAVQLAMAHAADTGERALFFVDADFSGWPLNDTALLDALTRWAHPQRRLTLLAHHFDEMPRKHPRFVAWRRTWSHLISCRAAPEVDASEVPTLLLAGARSLQVIEKTHWRGRWLVDESEQRTWAEVVDAILQRSEEAFPATNLGL